MVRRKTPVIQIKKPVVCSIQILRVVRLVHQRLVHVVVAGRKVQSYLHLVPLLVAATRRASRSTTTLRRVVAVVAVVVAVAVVAPDVEQVGPVARQVWVPRW